MAKAPTRTDIVRLAGLDRTTEQLTAEHIVVLKKRESAFWRFARNRLAKLDERLRPRDLLLRAGGWTVATIGIIVALTFLTPIVITHTAVNAMIVGVIFGGTYGLFFGLSFGVIFGGTYGVIGGVAFGVTFGVIGGVIFGGIGGMIVGGIVGMISGMIVGGISGAIKTALITAKPRVVKIRKYRKNLLPYLFPPIMPFVKLFDAWLVAHREHPALIAISEEARNSPEKYIEETYLRGLARVREEFLGEGSAFTRVKKPFEERQQTLLTRIERTQQRLKKVHKDINPQRYAVYQSLLEELNRRADLTQEELDQIERLMAKTDAILSELESDILNLREPLSDASFIREMQEGNEEDEILIAQANLVLRQEVERLRQALVQLHAIVADALIAPRTNGEMKEYYAQLDRRLDRVVELERSVTEPITTTTIQ